MSDILSFGCRASVPAIKDEDGVLLNDMATSTAGS